MKGLFDNILYDINKKENKNIAFLYLSRSIIEGITLEDCFRNYTVEREMPEIKYEDIMKLKLEYTVRLRIIKRKIPLEISPKTMGDLKYDVMQILAKALDIEF